MPSLVEALYNLPTETLRKLVQARRMDAKKLALIPNKRQLAQFLSAELNKPTSLSDAITQCNARELRLLQLLMITEIGQAMAWDKLLEMAGGQSVELAVSATLSRLEELGLAFRVGAQALLPDAARSYIPASLSDRYTLERCLDQYDAQSLKRICATLGLPQETKPLNVRAIKSYLMEHARTMSFKNPLTEDEVAVLEFMVQSNGDATALEVATTALKGRTEDFFRYDWQNRWKMGNERNAIDTLLARGILHVVAYGYGYNLFLVIPGDLLRALSGGGDQNFWTGPVPAPVPLPASPERTSRHPGLLRDVVALLGYVSAQDAVRTNTGHIHKTSLKNLARTLSVPEERYASFLYAVCREAGLIAVQGEKQVYTITPAGNSWLAWDSLAQTRALTDAWRKGMLWSEMYNDPLHKANDYRSQEAIQRLRQSALSVIVKPTPQSNISDSASSNTGSSDNASANANSANSVSSNASSNEEVFYALDSISDTLTFQYPLLLAHSAAMGSDLVSSPTAFIRLLVGECLYWLGLVELAEEKMADTQSSIVNRQSEISQPSTSLRGAAAQKPTLPDAAGYRLTPMGRFLLGVMGAPAPAPDPREDQFIVQASGEIFLSPYLEPSTLYHLLAMTEPPAKGGTGNTVSLTRDSIRRCLDQGEQTRDVLAFLQGHARTGIPQNVEYLINDVGGKHGHIHIGKAQMYVQVDTPLLLKELEARRELKPYFVRSLSDTVAILKADDPDKLLRELRKAGYLPVSDDDKPQSTLSLKTKNAPPVVPIPIEVDAKKAKYAAKVDATLDWDRIAQEDGKSWQTQTPSVTPGATPAGGGTVSNVVRNQTLIKTLLMQASKTHTVVEIEYLETGKPGLIRREIEPGRIMGQILAAYDRLTNEQMTFNITRIQWARLTGELFE